MPIIKSQPSTRYFFTFGAGHPYSKCYVEIITPDAEAARNVMFEAHKDRWAFQYSEDEFEGQIEKWNLHCLAHIQLTQYGWRKA